MNKPARERRRFKNLLVDADTSPGENQREPQEEQWVVVPEHEPFIKQSDARARRRARMREAEAENERKTQRREQSSEDVKFELLKRAIETQSRDKTLGKRAIDHGISDYGAKMDGLRFSEEYEAELYEDAKGQASKTQLQNKKNYLLRSYFSQSRHKVEPLEFDRSSIELKSLSDSSQSLRNVRSQNVWDADKENYSHAKILATLVPDEVLKDVRSVEAKQFNAAVLFADVSGFTELSERFDKTGKGGPSRLTDILNNHIGAMIEVVLTKKGDVCKFGGDAIICFWKATSESNLYKAVSLAIDSALDMQKLSQDKSDVGVQIRLKIAIAAGEAMFSVIGNYNRKYYIFVGKPVIEATKAEKLCRPGEVMVAPSAWKRVSNNLLYTHSLHANKSHVLVMDHGPLSNQVKYENKFDRDNSNLSVRPALKLHGNIKLEDLRPFILPFVMKCIDVKEPLDYLTEMRQVAIVFIKLNIDELGLSPAETISISDQAYQCVCHIVDKADGTVNKLTYFDKDVSILTVFGLRGFQHELASKVALKCAYDCLENLRTLSKTIVSAGVTTGMAYCGVIGHPLRREYTVMGFPVNKAARFMCAYPNIVSCDRETFLQSKLRSEHFTVLEPKPLKGIHDIGPVYKFTLFLKNRIHNARLESHTQSILGRSREISEFEEFMRNCKNQSNLVNFFVIYGSARIGKTRLISTFVQIAEKYFSEGDPAAVEIEDYQKNTKDSGALSSLEICFISLTEEDYRTSFQTVRLILQPALGLNDSSTVEEREEKIMSKMGDVKDTYFLATLNPILNVKFGFSNTYLSMDKEEQRVAKTLTKKRLHKVCFSSDSRWLVVIDDAEFIDEASWLFLKWCCTISNQPLFLMSIGQQKALSSSASECLLSIPQKKLVLTELDKWFYTALACQFLEVKAIPVELEILLQGFKSSGNPGWLESYLLSLLQTDCLEVTYVTRQEMNNMRLVAAAEESMSSNASDLLRRSRSPYWLDWVETFKGISSAQGSSEIVPVCVIGPKFDEKYESELTMDMMYVKTVDQLKPLEQAILKAGSVLGYNFKRDAIIFLINKELSVEERTFAKAIKNLFEIRILCCDRGDFTCPSSLIMNRRSISKDKYQKEIKCYCIGLTKSEVLQNLPDYAACGFMRFRSQVFKDTVYNLLLDEQKKKFHNLSIEFLRKNTYKCKACRSVLFDRIFGREVNNELHFVCAQTPMHGVRFTEVKLPRYKPSLNGNDNIAEASRGILSEDSQEDFLLNHDVGDCQCPQILRTVYSSLLDHAEGAGRKDIMLEVSFEYASVCLTSYNIPLTDQIMKDTLALAKVIQEENKHPDLCTPFVFGKIYTLMGAASLNMGRTDTALDQLHMALKCLGKAIPKRNFEIKIKLQQVIFRNKFITEWFPGQLIGKVSDRKAAHLDLLSECLGLMCIVHLYAKNWFLAKFTSTWALNKALKSHRNFFGLCTSYANMMDVAYHYNDKGTSSKMELLAIDICEKCSKKRLELYELEAIARLYQMIFRTRHARAKIEDAIYIGFKSLRIATITRNSILRLDLMPDLIFALMQMYRLSEAVSLAQELEFASKQYCDKTGRTWYYTLCVEFQLDTGYTILPYKACENFVDEEEENLNVIRSLYATERLYTSMWLWCIRNREWEAAKRFATLMKHYVSEDKMKTPSSVCIKLKKLEGFLITLVDKLDKRIVHTNISITSEITTIMKSLEKDIELVPLLEPRYLLLKAYYMQIKNPGTSVMNILHLARYLANKMKDKTTVDWIIHNKLVWRNATTAAQKTFWNDHCKYDDFIDWHEAETSNGIEAFMFSLPLPDKQ